MASSATESKTDEQRAKKNVTASELDKINTLQRWLSINVSRGSWNTISSSFIVVRQLRAIRLS